MTRNRIRDFRLAKGLSQAEMAERIGAAETTVSDYERGRRFPRMAYLFAMTELLDCTIDDLYPREGR